MEISKRFLHDRVVLLLLALISVLLVVGVSLVLLRFDASKNPTTIAQYRQNLSGSGFVSGKPIDIYSMAIFMFVASFAGLALATKAYSVRRYVSIFILSSTLLLMILSIIVSNSLISLQ